MEFRSVLSNLPEYLRDYTLFAYLTGWRAGEVKSLSWANLDGDTIKLRAENSKNRTARSGSTGGGTGRIDRKTAAANVSTDSADFPSRR